MGNIDCLFLLSTKAFIWEVKAKFQIKRCFFVMQINDVAYFHFLFIFFSMF